MPAWKSLDEGEAWDLAAYLLGVADRPGVDAPVSTFDH